MMGSDTKEELNTCHFTPAFGSKHHLHSGFRPSFPFHMSPPVPSENTALVPGSGAAIPHVPSHSVLAPSTTSCRTRQQICESDKATIGVVSRDIGREHEFGRRV